MSPAAAAAALAAAAVGALLAAEFRGVALGRWIAKPVASAAFVAVAWLSGAADSAPGRATLVALLLCAAGDVLLLPRGAGAAFRAGLASFLLAHVAFAAAFALRGVAPLATLAAAALLAGAGVLAWRWLAGRVPPKLAVPVRVYVAAIVAMTALGVGAAAGPGPPALAAGALLFFVSDLAVARERFVQPSPWNRVWGLPLYYGATLILAFTA